MAVKPEMRVTRLTDAPAYVAPAHHDVAAFRLQGREAGPTEHFWVGLTYYLPGGGTDEVPTGQETVYVVLDGELTIHADGRAETLGPQDSVHLAPGTPRRLENRTARTATLLVVIASPPAAPEL
jgi:quercetin dioxygenase-like cupin family protein